MGKFSEAEEPETRNAYRQRGCGIARLLQSEGIDDDDRAAITARVRDNDSYTDKSVVSWFKALGVTSVTLNTVQRHRRGDCCDGTGKVR